MNANSVVVVIGVYSLLAWMLRTFLVNRRLAKTARLQAELQTRVLDKLGTAQEVLAYLESPAGQRLSQAVPLETGNPHGRILGSVQSGLILALVGAAMLALRGQFGGEEAQALTLVGASGVALGIGFLASAYIAYRLSKSWGLLAAGGGDPTGAKQDAGAGERS